MQSITFTLLTLIVFFLSGCNNTKSQQKLNNMPPSARQVSKNENKPAEKNMAACQGQLLALSKVNNSLYIQKKKIYDDLVSGASVYTAVRNDIGSETKETLDALYKFKTQKLCNDIEQTLRQTLINRGENIK